MLLRLEIENYGLIARGEIDFAGGATIFTGETGSGKTMLLGAIAFALGARAGSDVVRKGAAKATVAIAFDPDDALRAQLAGAGFELDPGESATIVREMNDAGRSTMRVNGRPSTAALVREMADGVAEIVGQHEAQRLLSPAYHLELLDRFAGTRAGEARAAVASTYARHADLQASLDELQGDERRARERYDAAVFALREIEAVNVAAGEDERLEERRRFLENVERVASALRRALEAIAGEESSATQALGDASVALAAVADVGAGFAAMANDAAALQSESNDLAARVARSLEATEFDPGELDAINARLDALDKLRRRYGPAFDDVRSFAENARTTVDEFEGRDRRGAELAAEVSAAAAQLTAAAAALAKLRRAAARALERKVTGELPDLALGSGNFRVDVRALEGVSPNGSERVEFLFAANAGEDARPLGRVASGGELSRLLLALVVALSGTQSEGGALVFDEIDAGIGGATALAVGARIGRLARDGQIVAVTHLAQLATWADRHYVLEKTETAGETTISVAELTTPAAREGELARMLSGETHEPALHHARALLDQRIRHADA